MTLLHVIEGARELLLENLGPILIFALFVVGWALSPVGGTMNLWDREPALILGAVQAVLVLGVSFGLDLTTEQTAAILAATAAILAVVTRQRVTPI